MDPVFTLQWPEFLLAQELQQHFPKSQNYSVLVPASRQEKGVDLALVRKRARGPSSIALIQVKASRTYSPESPKRGTSRRFRYFTWFNRFDPSPQADFFLLMGLYAPDTGRTRPVTERWYRHCSLLLTYAEMRNLMRSCKTKGGQPDRMFGFGFDDESAVFQTRGDRHRRGRDFSEYVLKERVRMLREFL